MTGPAQISGTARMNIAAADDDTLTALRKFFAAVADHGTDQGKISAPAYMAAIDDEMALRERIGP